MYRSSEAGFSGPLEVHTFHLCPRKSLSKDHWDLYRPFATNCPHQVFVYDPAGHLLFVPISEQLPHPYDEQLPKVFQDLVGVHQ